MEIKISIPALEKLVDYAASGIGSVAGHFFAGWLARREAEKRRILAEGDAKVQQVLIEGRATGMQVLAKAQAEARQHLISPDAAIQGEVIFEELVKQRIRFQEEKRQVNIGSVLERAALEIGDKEVVDHEPDHDWTARFFSDVQDVSSEEMQQLWARVLAGEVERPGSTSIKTLAILKNLNMDAAHLFQLLCSLSVFVSPDGTSFYDARVPSLGGDPGNNILKPYGLDYGSLNILNEHGFITSSYNSWYDIKASIGFPLADKLAGRMPFRFQRAFWVLVPKAQRDIGKEFRLSGVALTRSGQELSRIVDIESNNQYAQDLKAYLLGNNLEMVEVESWQTQIFVPSGQ